MVPGLNFVAIDFETATGKRDSACAVGWVEVQDGLIVHKGYRLIRPHTMDFNPITVRIHGIRPENVINEPTFDIVWTDLEPRLRGKKIIAHNAAGFEISVLKASLTHYNLPQPDFDYGCTLQAAKALGLPLKLNEICQHLSIDLSHHNALSDAEACALVAIYQYQQTQSYTIFDPDYSYRFTEAHRTSTDGRAKDYFRSSFSGAAELDGLNWFDIGSVGAYNFQGKTIVITGVFEQYPDREELARILINKGAKVGSGISGKTNVILIGSKAGPSKINKLKDMVAKGMSVDLIHETDVYELLK